MDEITQEIGRFVVSEIQGTITEVEENCGTMWITTESGDVFAVSVTKCESED